MAARALPRAHPRQPATGKPLVIHTRSASADTLAVLRDEGRARSTGVFHCFTETMDVAPAALDLGFMISFSGILTFKTAADLREVARHVPLERCLIETDSPYLAPAPFPRQDQHARLCALRGAPSGRVERRAGREVREATSRNFERLFGIPPL
jgi:TatD DNase family protein